MKITHYGVLNDFYKEVKKEFGKKKPADLIFSDDKYVLSLRWKEGGTQ